MLRFIYYKNELSSLSVTVQMRPAVGKGFL